MTDGKQQQKKQQPEASKNVWRRIFALSFVAQAALIAVQGNLDVLSGKPVLDVIQGMIAQGIELIIKAQRTEANLKETERKSR